MLNNIAILLCYNNFINLRHNPICEKKTERISSGRTYYLLSTMPREMNGDPISGRYLNPRETGFARP